MTTHLAITTPSGVRLLLPETCFGSAAEASPGARIEIKNINSLHGLERAASMASEVLVTAASHGYYLRHSVTVSPKAFLRTVDAGPPLV